MVLGSHGIAITMGKWYSLGLTIKVIHMYLLVLHSSQTLKKYTEVVSKLMSEVSSGLGLECAADLR